MTLARYLRVLQIGNGNHLIESSLWVLIFTDRPSGCRLERTSTSAKHSHVKLKWFWLVQSDPGKLRVGRIQQHIPFVPNGC